MRYWSQRSPKLKLRYLLMVQLSFAYRAIPNPSVATVDGPNSERLASSNTCTVSPSGFTKNGHREGGHGFLEKSTGRNENWALAGAGTPGSANLTPVLS